MTRNTMTRAGAVLALMALVAVGPSTAAAGERAGLRGERRAAVAAGSGETGFFAGAWRWLVSVWGKQGSMIDPNGVTPPPPPTSTTTTTTSSPLGPTTLGTSVP
jgi:hypothetical protein